MYLKKGEYLYKENGEWYVKKINFKTIPITKEDYEIENERLNNIINKAIETLEDRIEYSEGCIYVEIPEEKYILEQEEILNILKGSDKE